MIQSLSAYLLPAWSKISKLGVNFLNRQKSLLSKSNEQVKKLLPLVKRHTASGISYLVSLVASQSLKLQSLLAKVKSLITSQLMKLKSRLTSSKT